MTVDRDTLWADLLQFDPPSADRVWEGDLRDPDAPGWYASLGSLIHQARGPAEADELVDEPAVVATMRRASLGAAIVALPHHRGVRSVGRVVAMKAAAAATTASMVGVAAAATTGIVATVAATVVVPAFNEKVRPVIEHVGPGRGDRAARPGVVRPPDRRGGLPPAERPLPRSLVPRRRGARAGDARRPLGRGGCSHRRRCLRPRRPVRSSPTRPRRRRSSRLRSSRRPPSRPGRPGAGRAAARGAPAGRTAARGAPAGRTDRHGPRRPSSPPSRTRRRPIPLRPTPPRSSPRPASPTRSTPPPSPAPVEPPPADAGAGRAGRARRGSAPAEHPGPSRAGTARARVTTKVRVRATTTSRPTHRPTRPSRRHCPSADSRRFPSTCRSASAAPQFHA